MNDMVNDGLPKLTKQELQDWRYLLALRESVLLQIENFTLKLFITKKIDPSKYAFNFETGQFVEVKANQGSREQAQASVD